MSYKTDAHSLKELHSLPITLDGTDVEKKREEIRDYFHKSYTLFEKLFDVYKNDDVFYLKSEPTRHPMIFYFGHTATFFINKLIVSNILHERINPEFEAIFAVGVDEMSWDDLNSSNYNWPDIKEVRAYRNLVRQKVDDLISTLPLKLPITEDDAMWIILMGIEHERIHIETSSVLHRQLPIDKVQNSGFFPRCYEVSDAPENELIDIQGAKVRLGKERNHNLYGWDNEYGKKEVEVSSFKCSKYLVSNAEYLPFVLEGGYETMKYWDEEGINFLKYSKIKHPPFWIQDKQKGFKYRSMLEEIDMPLNWPVDVNYLEAKAFCRWKSTKENKNYRLLTEPEWYLLYERANISDVPDFDDSSANINFRHWASSCPVDKFSFGDIFDLTGNVWQWSETHIDGFEGFKVHYAYDDFSIPTFDGKHNLIKGGSWASSGNELMKYSRYAFRRHFYQHAGFRYVEAQELNIKKDNIYESDELISQYCDFQYGQNYLNVENFAKTCAEKAVKYTQDSKQDKALDLGCATGRCSFELAKVFNTVEGVDFSARFIQVGVELQKKGTFNYYKNAEGELKEPCTVSLEELGLDKVTHKIEFRQGDACNLKSMFKNYDLIMATNLIDRLYEPSLFLKNIHERINSGGFLILTSPYTWLEEYTKKEFWLGGYKDKDGNEVLTLDTLKSILEENFQLIDTEDIPFVIRETPRKFQHTISQMSIWKKR